MEILDIKKVKISFMLDELKRNKVFFVPTDTCYGILGNINKDTITKIFNIKRRPLRKSLPVFVSKKWVKDFIEANENFNKIVKVFWPGPLTIIARPSKRKIFLLKSVINRNGTIGVREPKFKLLNNILDKYGQPLTSTSANLSKMDPCYSLEDLLMQFRRRKYRPDYIINAGVLPKTKSSSIIDLYTLKLLRAGEITRHVVIKKIK